MLTTDGVAIAFKETYKLTASGVHEQAKKFFLLLEGPLKRDMEDSALLVGLSICSDAA
jgi:hypothetical protein